MPRTDDYGNYNYTFNASIDPGDYVVKANSTYGVRVAEANETLTIQSCSVDFNMTINLQNGIVFGVHDPDTNISAAGNWFYNITDLSASVCGTVNVSIRATSDLVNGSDSIEIGNVTVNSTSSGSQNIQLSTSYQLIRSNVPAGDENVTDLHFWLSVPAGQSPKYYNTTIYVMEERE